MRSAITVLMATFLFSMAIAGCFAEEGSDSSNSPVKLIVHYDQTSGVIEDTWNNGQQTSSTGVTIEFDFARTTSEDGDITLISVDPGDGSEPLTSNPSDNAKITYEWVTHGLYGVILSATDSKNNTDSQTIKIRIDHHIIWRQDNTNNPTTQPISLNSDNEITAEELKITSTVENREAQIWEGGGTPVDVTWTLLDSSGEEAESCASEQIGDGQSHTCEMTERTISEGDWSLQIDLAQDESVNIDNDILIAYAQDESPANPIASE
jgi:hypothetical protein